MTGYTFKRLSDGKIFSPIKVGKESYLGAVSKNAIEYWACVLKLGPSEYEILEVQADRDQLYPQEGEDREIRPGYAG